MSSSPSTGANSQMGCSRKSQITIYADYVFPFCLLAERVLADEIGGRSITIAWRAFELRPEPAPTLRVEDGYLPSVWRNSVYPLAEHLGVSIKLPLFSPQPRSTKAFELLVMAQESGLDHPYSMRILRAFFQDGRDIGDPETPVALAADAGLDPVQARAALETGTYVKQRCEALRQALEELDANQSIRLANAWFQHAPERKIQ